MRHRLANLKGVNIASLSVFDADALAEQSPDVPLLCKRSGRVEVEPALALRVPAGKKAPGSINGDYELRRSESSVNICPLDAGRSLKASDRIIL
jgi:hypothetical protein